LFSIKNIEAHNLIVDFACNKTEIENKHEAAQEKESKKKLNIYSILSMNLSLIIYVYQQE
jgi:hypothetical protein